MAMAGKLRRSSKLLPGRTAQKALCVVGVEADMVFPNEGDAVLRFDFKVDYGALLVRAGVFPSVKQAWDKGFSGDVPIGWNDLRINGTRVYIYNPKEAHKKAQEAEQQQSLAAFADDGGVPWDDEDILDPCAQGWMHLGAF